MANHQNPVRMKLNKITNSFSSKIFAKFAVAGILSAIVNYSIFLFLFNVLGLFYILSSAIGYISGALFVLALNKPKIFRSKDGYRDELIKYFLVYAFSLFFGLSMLKTLVHNYNLSPAIANIWIICVTSFTNFFGCKFFVFRKIKIPRIFKNKLFLYVLLLKIIFSFLFGSDYIVKGFAPFVSYFISSGFRNPYDFFLSQGLVKSFPYPTMMLFSVSFPSYIFYFLLNFNWHFISPINLFLVRVPLLLADIGIFYILTLLLKSKENNVLVFYWCSPIVFYISYFHGQLDAIPVFFMMLAIYLLFIRKELLSFFVLGLSLASKSNIFAAVPFIFLYLWRNRYGILKIIKYFGITFFAYILLICPFLFSAGYRKLVLLAEEQGWLFILQVPYVKDNLIIYIAPLAISILFFRMAYFKSINRDSFIMSLTVVFIILVSLVPPRPGWFFWSVPFLTYFFIKDESVSKKYYFMISIFYILYFIVLHQASDIFQSFQVISSFIPQLNNPHYLLSGLGLNAALLSDIIFTLFVGVLMTNAFFVYKNGIISNLAYKISSLNFGIAGDSGSGKSWTANLIKSLVSNQNMTLLEGDDLHKWERGDRNWKDITHLNPKGNYLNLDLENLNKIQENKAVFRRHYDHKTGKFTSGNKIIPSKFVLMSGLHSFYLNRIRQLLDIKIFMNPDDKLRRHWKIIRDVRERSHKKQHIVGQLEKRSGDSGRYIAPQKKFADIVINYSPKSKIKHEGSPSEKIKLVLSLTVNNNYSPHDILDLLSGVKTLNAGLSYDENMSTYTCRFDGSVGKKDLENIAYSLVPNLEEVLDNNKPEWHDGYDGIVQLFIFTIISENLKNKKFYSHD